jgi:hypothetical protein
MQDPSTSRTSQKENYRWHNLLLIAKEKRLFRQSSESPECDSRSRHTPSPRDTEGLFEATRCQVATMQDPKKRRIIINREENYRWNNLLLIAKEKRLNRDQSSQSRSKDLLSRTARSLRVLGNFEIRRLYQRNDPTTHPFMTKPLRQRQNRTTFLFFAILSLLCSSLLLRHMYRPVQSATQTSNKVLVDAQIRLTQVESALGNVALSALLTDEIVEDLFSRVPEICPNLSPLVIGERLGVDPMAVMDSVIGEYNLIKVEIRANIEGAVSVLKSIDSVLEGVETGIESVDNMLWVLPTILATSIVVTIMALLGVVVAWRGGISSGERLDTSMSYFVLPLLIIITTIGWILVLCTCFGTVLIFDFCTAGPYPGTPDTTIATILTSLDLDSSTFQLVNAYTTGWQGVDPTAELVALEKIIEEKGEMISTLSMQVGTISLDVLREECGADSQVDEFVSGISTLLWLFGSIRQSLGTTRTAMDCPGINRLYTRAFHESICTDVATASAAGFVLFFLVVISNMSLITLLASWFVY